MSFRNFSEGLLEIKEGLLSLKIGGKEKMGVIQIIAIVSVSCVILAIAFGLIYDYIQRKKK